MKITYEIVVSTDHAEVISEARVQAVTSALTDAAHSLELRFELLDIRPKVFVTYRVDGGKPTILTHKEKPNG
jgi:hypothetical protein